MGLDPSRAPKIPVIEIEKTLAGICLKNQPNIGLKVG